jgi:hypothetical protein
MAKNPWAPSLEYEFSSVVSHGVKGLNGGHWAASVRGLKHVFSINDGQLDQENPLELRTDP